MRRASPMQEGGARRCARLALLLLAPLTAGSCLIGSDTQTHHEGRRISQETLDRVQLGNSEAYVLALLGEPTSRTPVESGRQVWKWAYRTVKRSEGSVLLLVSSDSRSEDSGAVFVEFQDGAVARTWRD